MNKFELINRVLVSNLGPGDKNLLVELIVRADEHGECYPSVTRLCQVRGIKHEKNFKGADHYLPGLVTKVRRGKRNFYVLNTPAIEGVTQAEVTKYQGSWQQRNPEVTPAVEGVSQEVTPSHAEVTPAVEGVVTPARAEVTPSQEGVDSTKNNTEDSSMESTATTLAGAHVDEPSLNSQIKERSLSSLSHTRRDDLLRKAAACAATEEQVLEAAYLLTTKAVDGYNWREQRDNALAKAGVNMEEW